MGLPLEVTSAETGIALRLIPAGSFTMGSPTGEAERGSAELPHQVTLRKGFYCGKYPVTQGQWQAVMGETPSHSKAAGAEAPVEQVSWEDCQGFLKKLCQREDVREGTYRLLTEAEWEYACRAGTATLFCYGDSLSPSQANFDGNYPYGGAAKGEYRETTTAVGQFKANGWGLYELHGSAWEWCNDGYGEYAGATDPAGPGWGSSRVLRGGSWFNRGVFCRSAYRYGYEPGIRYDGLGFRLARAGA
jgi:formylglycine-generating enzyme required for sulfatase activity